MRNEHLANMEMSGALSTLSYLASDYSIAYQRDGAWPEPGTVYDDSGFNFIDSTTNRESRIDQYETMSGRRVTIVLNNDGTLRCIALPAEDE